MTSWFLGKGYTENNKRHSHFITTLERVCETLEWKTNKSSKPDVQQPPPTSDDKEDEADVGMFLNKFAVLTVEEPQQKQGVSPESQQMVKVDLVEDDQEETDSYLGNSFFKALCLFQDLSNMRAFISHTWSEYREKKIDPMNAALVTDGALQLARDLV